ncbi:hypothetical protein ACEPPN_007478 [Leptodophora sp. 'Broadleaf-Isolate-01']
MVSILSVWLRPTQSKVVETIKAENHVYVRGEDKYRGPCPGLNALANHGFLPRDGQAISIDRLKAVLAYLRMSGTLSNVLVSAVVQVINSKPNRSTFDLQDLSIHGLLEHDASLTRLDVRDGDNVHFQPELFELMLADATHGHDHKSQANEDDSYTIRDIARTRARRTLEHQKSNAPAVPLMSKLASILEAAAVPVCLGGGGINVSLTEMKTLFTEEKLPDWIVNPSAAKEKTRKLTAVGLLGMMWVAFQIWVGGWL